MAAMNVVYYKTTRLIAVSFEILFIHCLLHHKLTKFEFFPKLFG